MATMSDEPVEMPDEEGFEVDKNEGREWLPDEFQTPNIRVVTITCSQDEEWIPHVDFHDGMSPWEAKALIGEAWNIMENEMRSITAYSDDPDD